jgi:ATP-dependent DNA helicase RecG
MKDEEISQEMEKFKAGLKSIMLATTVIEVGVNIPNATLMVVESAENFGLSTLHQLRGRVGRGALQSYCFLISGSRAEAILARLKIIVNSTDGFFIAEKDMELRGSGAIFSKMQSGFEGFKFAKTNEDGELFQKARKLAREIFAKNPNLEGEINYLMRFYNYDTLINYFKI